MSPSISEDIPAPTPPRRPAPRDPLANALFLGLCALVALAPLPLGAARPLAWDVMGLWVAALLLGSLWLPLREPTRLRQDLTLPALLLAAVMAFVVFQAIPFGPGSWHNPVWEQAGEALGRAVPAAIAVDPQAALIGLFRYAMYAGIFYLAYLLAREAVRARRALKLVSWAGTGYAAYGLIVYGAGNRMILWLPKIAYPNDLTATFVNKNSFATYTGLALLATLALIVDSFVMRPRLDGDWRDRVRIAIEFLSPRVGLFACLFVQATALLLAHSRGGSVACLFGILLLVIAVSQVPSFGRARHWGLAAVPLAMVVIAFLISGGTLIERLGESANDAPGRLAIYDSTITAIRDFPIFGTGLGSFPAFFPLYRTDALPTGFINAAHNDYLETMLELGIPAAALLFAVFFWLAGLCARGIYRRRRDEIFPCLGIAASGLVGLHEALDFSLQIPAVTATYLFLMGIAVAQSRSSRDGGAS
ncbi:MAG TPA: O-antigen ligase family protein [Stellaceae bacterium]|nr:O-antigen ligase family protein [Stellaceae bacterium]